MIAAAEPFDELTAILATAIVGFACLVIVVATLTSFRAGRHTGKLFATQIGIGLEFLLAAGLIRLASIDTFAMIGITAAIIAVRRAIVLGLGYAARAAG
jgi:Protein of unknown function (DUF1622)